MSTQPDRKVIKIANIPLDGYAKTYLSDSFVFTNDLYVLSTTGFDITSTNDYYILIGNYEDEKAEIKLVDASVSTDTKFELDSNLTYEHSASDPVTFIPYNKIRIYGSTTSGSLPNIDSPIAEIDIDVTKQYTTYIYEGDDYDYFYTAYYNSNDATVSAFSDEINYASFGRNSAKRIIKSALRKANTSIDENDNGLLSWDTAIEILNDGLDEIMTRKQKWIFLNKVASGSDTVAGVATIEIPDDLSLLKFIKVDDCKLDNISGLAYDRMSSSTDSSGTPVYYTIKNNKYYLSPTPSGTYSTSYEYYRYPTEITDLTDDVDKEFASILTYFCGYQFASIRGNEKKATELYGQFEKNLERQVVQFTGPSQSGDAEGTEQTNQNYWE